MAQDRIHRLCIDFTDKQGVIDFVESLRNQWICSDPQKNDEPINAREMDGLDKIGGGIRQYLIRNESQIPEDRRIVKSPAPERADPATIR